MKNVILCFFLFFSFHHGQAQHTLGTGLANNNTVSGVSFEIEATSAIKVTGILNEYQSSASTVNVWIRWGGVDGIPGDRLTVNSANGWFLHQSAVAIGPAINGIAPISNFNPIHIPVGAKLGVVLAASMYYHGSGSTPIVPDTFTGTHAILRSGGPTTGFGGSVPNLANKPRAFIGSIVYERDVAGNCANEFASITTDSITTFGAKISWVPGVNNNAFWMEYGLAGFTPGSGTKISGTYPGTQPAIYLTGLVPNTNYEYYVGEICNSATDSIFSLSPMSFTTDELCSKVTNLRTSNITGTTARVNWDYAGTATSFTIYFGLAGSAIGSADSVSVSGVPYTLTGLFGNADYEIFTVVNCGGINGNSDAVGPVSFKTACGPMATPFTENFDNTANGSASKPSEPHCWTYTETPGAKGYGYTYNASTYARSGSKSWRMSNSTTKADGDSMAFVSPQIANMTTVNKQISFWTRSLSSSTAYDVKFVVGTVASPSQLNTFVPIDTIHIGNNITYQNFMVYFAASTGYNGTHEYIAFLDMSDVNDTYIFDDITISDAPNCIPSTGFSFSNITNSSVDVSWISGEGITQQLEYGPEGFTQGLTPVYRGLTGSFTLANLSGNACYDVYVRDSCASGFSPWKGPYTVCTLCNFHQTPIVEGFESTPTGTNANPSEPFCWNFVKNGNSTGFGYTRDLAGGANTGNNFFYSIAKSNLSGDDYIGLVSPGVVGLTNGNIRLSLWARCDKGYAVDTVRFIIGTVTSPLEMHTFVPLDTFLIGNSKVYTQFSTDITVANSYNGTHNYIAILDKSSKGTGAGTTAFLDDILISEIPGCNPSSNISAQNITYHSVDIGWDAGQGSTHNIEYGPTGFIQGTGTIIKGLTGTNYNISNLTANTCYDVYVQDSCAIGLSPWSGPITLCASCPPAVVPLFEDFEVTAAGSSSNPSQPSCWTYWKAPSTIGFGYTYASAAPNGTKHFRMYSLLANTGDSIALISPAIAGISNFNKKISFYAKTNAANTLATVIVGTTPSPNSLRNATILDTVAIDGAAYNTKFSVSLNSISTYNGADEYIFLMHGNSTTYTYVHIDDISIEEIPPCVPPAGLAVNNVTANSADLSWTSAGGTAFRLEYGLFGFTQGTGGNGIVLSNATSPTSISGLSPNTRYQFYVADNCDSLNFTGPFDFKTDCVGPISGVFTVGSLTADFKTLDSALYVLNSCGVNGSVTFNLQGGQHNITTKIGNVAGASATHLIKLVGGAVSADTITNMYSVANVLDLDGSKYVSFNNLTIEGAGKNRIVWLHNGSKHITFDQVEFLGTPTNSSSSNLVVGSSSVTSALGGSENVSNLTIMNSKFYGGYHGLIILGTGQNNMSSDFVIENNVFEEQYFYGIRLYHINGLAIKGNKIAPTSGTSYGITLSGIGDYEISGNESSGGNYALHITDAEKSGAATVKSLIANNALIGGKSGLYLKTVKQTNIYHNSILGIGRSVFLEGNFNNNLSVKNNIFAADTGAVVHAATVPGFTVFDYNLYYTKGHNAFVWGSNSYATLTAWQTGASAINDSSLFGNPLFLAPDDLHIALGTLADDKGDNSVNIVVDLEGNPRPMPGATRVDIGAYEYTPILTDVGLQSASLRSSLCLSDKDTVQVTITNVSGTTIDFSVDSVVVAWNVAGPIASAGTLVADTGLLPVGASKTLMFSMLDMSVPGFYNLNAYVLPSNYNSYAGNDTASSYTINIYQNFVVSPLKDTLSTLSDTASLTASSVFFGRDNFFITEICHNAGSATGIPSGGRPSWLLADDYIEITGVPNADLGGVTLEQWSATGLFGSFTFVSGTTLSPAGTAVIAVGALAGSIEVPSSYYYHGNGTYTGSFSSSVLTGRILKNANNKIIDAVGYGDGFKFPAAAGVSTAEWGGASLSGVSSWGIRLEGPDQNSALGWVKGTQNPNAVNASVQVPVAGSTIGFAWSKVVGGTLVQVGTQPTYKVGESSPGIFYYVASYTNSCGTLQDTVTIYSNIAGCTLPTTVSVVTGCEDATIVWNSDAASITSYIEYGLKGFAYGSGTPIYSATSPQYIANLQANVVYDFYLTDSCTVGGMSVPIKLTDSTEFAAATANYTWVQATTTSSTAIVDFDASTSANGVAYTWDFGDLSPPATGVSVAHQYALNGLFYATLTVAGLCDTVVYGDTIVVMGISIQESILSRTMEVFPNPSNGNINVSFQTDDFMDVTILVTNALGQKLTKLYLGNISGKTRQELSLENQAPGVYFVQIIANGHSVVKRIVIQ